jgi:hypothetical protein
MAQLERCDRCGHALEILSKPVRRLRWTRYWWQGVTSLFTGPMQMCPQCGAIYSAEGVLLAAGAIETDTEHRLNVYRRDMAYLRDAFGGIILASGVALTWLLTGADSFELAKVIAASTVGGVSFAPFIYFGHKARLAKRDLKRLREARQEGRILRSQGS